ASDVYKRQILQSASTRTAPAYSMRYWAKGSRVAVRGANSGLTEFQDFAVYNLGTNPDVIRATVDPGTLPAGWSCAITDGVSDYSGYVDLPLQPGEGRIFRLKVDVGGSGYALPKVVLTSDNLPGKTRDIPYGVLTDDLEVLLVDDDGAESYEALRAAALESAGATYGIWPRSFAEVAGADLLNFPIVDWNTALSYPTLDAGDRDALSAYLDGGGRLLLSGQEIGWELDDTGGSALDWYHDYLHADFISDDSNQNVVNGIPGDPISDGLSLSLTASLNPYPDVIAPFDGAATPIFNYGTGTQRAGLKVDTGTYKVVYLGFGVEAITTQESRDLLTQRAINWLRQG
ncbi:MAG: hypothetical protein QUU85_12750, partial [Candidatus Eisenbacteria bacterium]|nr:hypothetical protein [Candidatus Eisenbacteria bacterium]